MKRWLCHASLLLCCLGCGTTNWSDSQRTGTEQLLISDAIDQAVSRIDFQCLQGKKSFLDATALRPTVDAPYLASSLRQQMFAAGCRMTDRREDADYIVEARSGGVGTDRREVLFGIPTTKMTDAIAIPEIAFAKKVEQQAIAKVALYAYNRLTGEPVWQSGASPAVSQVKDVWVLGTGPTRKGSLVERAKLAERKGSKRDSSNSQIASLSATDEKEFAETPGMPPLVAEHPSPISENPSQAMAKGNASPLESVMHGSQAESDSAAGDKSKSSSDGDVQSIATRKEPTAEDTRK
jgi:hypothetical protein